MIIENVFQIITELRKQVNDLEAKTLTDLPSDAQEIIQTYKEKLEFRLCSYCYDH